MRTLSLLIGCTALMLPAAAQSFDSCGTLEQGVTCPLLFRADTTGGLYVLDVSLGSLQAGDRIRAIGTLDTTCFTACNQGDGCIFGTLLQSCLPTTVGTAYCSGVPNSSGHIGVVGAFGSAQITANDLTIGADGLPPAAATLFLCSRTQGMVTQPGGSQGDLCLGGAIGRFVSQVGLADSSGAFLMSTDPVFAPQTFSLGALPQPTGSVAAMVGETWNFQAWHRDFVQGLGPTSNFTEGLSITFQ